MNTKITTHKELAEQIAGKSVLLMNSLGKDSALCLEWLANYAHPARIISLHFKYTCPNPDDQRYIDYQKKRYPHVEFVEVDNPFEVTRFFQGQFQEPITFLRDILPSDYDTFDPKVVGHDYREQFGCDFVCLGQSKYESFARAKLFHSKGILIDKEIYPIGLMNKAEVISLIYGTGIKVHPCYAYAHATLDQPSYFKYARAFKKFPEWEREFMRVFPLLILDKYRYEVLFGKKI